MPRRKGFTGVLRNIDDICKLTTGKKLHQILATSIELFGEDVFKKVAGGDEEASQEELARRMPYAVLGINPDAPDIVVRAAYKAIARDCFPDPNSLNPDLEKMKKVNDAYETICKERGIPK